MKGISELGISSAPWMAHCCNGNWEVTSLQENIKSLYPIRLPFMILESTKRIAPDEGKANVMLAKSAPTLYDCLFEAAYSECEYCEHPDDLTRCSEDCRILRWRKALAEASGESEVTK